MTDPRKALERLTKLRGPEPMARHYPSVSQLRADTLALLSLVEKQQEALWAAKSWMEEVTDPCGEPYNTICAALESGR